MKKEKEKLNNDERINKIRSSAEYKSKTKDFIEATKRYLFDAHKRKIDAKDKKSVKNLITPL